MFKIIKVAIFVGIAVIFLLKWLTEPTENKFSNLLKEVRNFLVGIATIFGIIFFSIFDVENSARE